MSDPVRGGGGGGPSSAEEWPLERPEAFSIVEAKVLRVHAHKDIVVAGTNHIDTSRWSPLFYVF
ncbi:MULTISPECIES: hypothetical protein [unclassified Rhizobium]|uniref:hypothetical protein n=1 Tax=unclassified Rhizobium TaxID=2613769 RepID=UPI0017DCA6E2|nr:MULTISPECIES: hypothetical protein [unclassified Rhizobium]MBB3291279.1 hypothetical protein [Rhizobium sp. BK252]MBB3406020.1 hypothetical protein [Rhizobium sp. BK289]MBB3418607.1 hypothetical protein [Rhizobium sp. BK284]MBB3486485.1 hypothetical protein [Rhizobium sp. BK347]MDK4724234.1 hypothetical protein [Rhizobium sp. CNPSo 3968]